MLQVAAMPSPAGDASSDGQPSPCRSISVSMAGCGSENSQVPLASQALTGAPVLDLARRCRMADRGDSVEVHAKWFLDGLFQAVTVDQRARRGRRRT
jgi:hypothetical protein